MNAIASSFSLMQNYPNPFASATTVQYAIPEQAFVTLTVFDALGREVKQLVNENQIAGVYTGRLMRQACRTARIFTNCVRVQI